MTEAETRSLLDQLAALGKSDDLALDEAAITKAYRANRAEFRTLVRRMKSISKGTGGLRSTGNQMFWSSVLFTRLTVTAQSVQESAPDPQVTKAHWDFSALASLVRNLVECYFVLYFLCLDDINDDERHARFLIMHIHDNFSRHRMLTELGVDEGKTEYFETNRTDLEQRIRQTAYFKGLPEKRQAVILKGDRTPFIQDEVLDKIGFDRQAFRGLYRLLSSHTHSGPIAFYRMHDLGRGTGVENRSDKVYMTVALGLAIQIGDRACGDILKLFPNAETRGAGVSDRDVSRHLKQLKEAQLRGEIVKP